MHERTERAIARLLFVFCCAVPTFVTLLIVLVTWTPWYHRGQLRELATELSRDTGLIVNLEDFQRISPFKTTLHNMRLIESETGSEVARIRQMTWLREADRIGILLRQPELQSSQLSHTWNLIHDRFLCRPEKTSVPLQFSTNDVTIHSATGSFTLREVQAWVEPQAEAIQANIQCLPAIGDGRTPVKITIRRERSGPTPRTQWTLETGDTPLPCSAVADWLPAMRRLGDEAAFTGMLQWEVDRLGHWTIDLGGSRFTNVDLSRLSEQMPHRLSGIADLILERCYVDPGKTVNVSGSITAREGWVGQSLLAAMHENLFIGIDQGLLGAQLGDVPYELFGIHFRISDSQLKLAGICNTERGYEVLPPGVVICTNRRPIAQTSDRTFPSLRLLRVLSPAHGELVPIASQTQEWMNLLIAPSRSIPVSDGMLPISRIRSAETWSGGEPILQR